jgi:hypothetical protein
MRRVRCLFCGRFVKVPQELDKTYKCNCGASYVASLAEDEVETIYELREEILGVPSKTEFLEVKKQDYDVLLDYPSQPKEEGAKVTLIFARKVSLTFDKKSGRIILERR